MNAVPTARSGKYWRFNFKTAKAWVAIQTVINSGGLLDCVRRELRAQLVGFGT